MSRDFSRKPCGFCKRDSVLPNGYCDSCRYHQTSSRCEHCDRDLSLNTPGDTCDNCDGFIGNPEHEHDFDDEDACTCGASDSPPNEHDDVCPVYVNAHEDDEFAACPKCGSDFVIQHNQGPKAGSLECNDCKATWKDNELGESTELDEASPTGPTYEDCVVCHGTGDDLGAGEEGEKCWSCGGTGKDRTDDAYVDPEAELERRPARPVGEGLSFDKFMDRTLLNESKRKTIDEKVSPQRRLARNYQENPLGKTRFGVK